MTVGPNLPYGTTVFCDDVRHEVGGKKSLMGIYSGDMIFAGSAPAVMPNLCVNITWFCGQDDLPNKLGFRIFIDGTDERQEVFSTDIEPAMFPPPPPLEPDALDPDAPRVVSLAFEARFLNLEFKENSRLRARAIVDGVEHRIGALAVRFTDDEAQAVSS